MSNNKKLFEEAIADAKALREAAVANAKAALEESFAPRISAMFEKRMRDEEEKELDETEYVADKDKLFDPLDEMYDADDNTSMEEDIDLEELFNSLDEDNMEDMYEMDSELYEDDNEDDNLEEEFDLEEILAELESEGEEVNEDDDMMNENVDEAASADEGIDEITVGELKKIIRDELHAAGLSNSEGEEEMGDEDFNLDLGDEEGEGSEHEAGESPEFEAGEEEEEKEKKKSKKKMSEEEELEELYSLYEAMKRRSYKGTPKEIDEAKKAGTSGGIAPQKNLAAITMKGKYKGPKEIREGDDEMEEGKKDEMMEKAEKMKKLKAMMEKKKLADKDEMKETKDEELKEAIRTIKTLRGQLNEVNLLNAKLIYVNRIFKSNNLNESQKVNIVNSFDKATTLNEAKNVYEILKNTIKKSSNKKTLAEGKTSFASKVIGGRPANQPIIKADESISRMQKLAGIK